MALASALMRPHITYMHSQPCATLVWHFCNDLGQFTLKDNKGWQKMTLCSHLQFLIPFYNDLQCSISHLQHFLTFSDALWSFVTFLDFALSILHLIASLFPACFIRPFSHGYCTIVLPFCVLFQANWPCALPMFHVSFYYYNCTYVYCYHHYQIQQRVLPLTVL